MSKPFSAVLTCMLHAAIVLGLCHSLYAQQTVRDPNRSFQKSVVSWKQLNEQNVVMQQQDYSCGAAAVATVLRYYWGQDVQENDVLKVLYRSLTDEALKDRTENGLSMADLKIVSDRLGYDAAVGKLDSLAALQKSKIPLIVSIKLGNQDHFVVYRGISHGMTFLADPIRGNVRLQNVDFARMWNEKAVFVVTLKGKTKSAVSRLDIRPEEIRRGLLNQQRVRRQLALQSRPSTPGQ